MDQTPDDSICRLLNQIKALNEVLAADQNCQPEQLKALRLLRLSLTSVVNNSAIELKRILDSIQLISNKFGAEPKLTNEITLQSFAATLEELLNGSSKNDAPQNLRQRKSELDSAGLACLMDPADLARVEQSLKSACQSLAAEIREIEKANLEIDQIRERLKKESDLNFEPESFAPRTNERPPVSNGDGQTSNKVLIVDDIAINQKLLAKRLQKMELEADFAGNGQQGVEMALAGDYALIFMDCDMPVMDGFEAARRIRRAEIGTGRHVPIIALTSHDREEDRDRCLSSGMDEYLNKSASPVQMQEIVDWCLTRSKVREEQGLHIEDYEEELDLSGLSKTFTREELDEILDLFLPSTNTLMRCLRMSMDDRDMRSIGHFAYSLKGPFASMGMLMTSKLTARLTDAAEENQWEEANDYYEMLARNCQAMRSKLEERAARHN